MARKALDRFSETEVDEHRRMDAMGQLSQLADRELELAFGLSDDLRGTLRVLVGELGGVPQLNGEPGQAELSTVVEILLQPPPRIVGGRDKSQARRAEAHRKLLALGHHGRQRERRECRDGDEQLGAENAPRDRFEVKRPYVVDRVPDGEERS